MKAPIAVMSFNRPDYLAEVLQSLRAQQGDVLEGREIHLFQDGARNRYSRIRYARDEDVAASIACFEEIFPEGEVHFAGDNIGVAENFSAAEEYFFLERKVECAYFLEDDMTLSPVYLEMMEILQRHAEASACVAYFAAYGDYYATRDEVAEQRREVITLDHHWAFGLLRRHWLRMYEILADYRKLVFGQDYARRYHRAIYEYYEQFAACPRGSSQDAAKAFACSRLGLWRCRTFAPFAKYIGTRGAHMTEDAYKTLGFSKTVVLEKVVPNVRFPNDRDIGRLLAQQTALFKEVYANELPEMRQTLPVRKFNPMRLCTEQDVLDAYLIFLHRRPEDPSIPQRHVGCRPVFLFVSGLLASEEFRGIVTAELPLNRSFDPERPCTPDDVRAGYHLLLHREVDSDSVLDRVVGTTGVLTFVKRMMKSSEFTGLCERISP
jgi:hypothetical protein